jgi:hypothetical protein
MTPLPLSTQTIATLIGADTAGNPTLLPVVPVPVPLSAEATVDVTAGPAATIALFFGAVPANGGASAIFVKSNTTTEGTWKNTYGADGFDVSQDPSANNPAIPSYATVSLAGATGFTWAATTAEIRALQKTAIGSTDRIAGTWYSTTSMSFDVRITDGNAHQVSLYALDWDSLGRTETIDILDTSSGTVLDSRTISGFQNGLYLVWTLTGDVTFRVTNKGPNNAVISGLFFATVPANGGASATFVKSDTTTEGSWKNTYGADGFDVSQDASANNPAIPSYAAVTFAGATGFTWASTTADIRALQKTAAGATDRIASTWYSPTSMSIDVKITDGNAHQVSLYALDWDNLGRSETIDVLNTASGAVLDSRTISGFQNGVYLVWTLTGDVTFRVTNKGPNNAVISGLFFGAVTPVTTPPFGWWPNCLPRSGG